MTTVLCDVLVPGTPVPQGWVRSLGKGRPSVWGNQEKLLPWRAHLTAAFAADFRTRHPGREPYGDAVAVTVRFYLRRPKTVKREYPTSPPDLDKLARVLDSLKAAGVLVDDSRICDLDARKRYADDCEPGVSVRVEILPPPA